MYFVDIEKVTFERPKRYFNFLVLVVQKYGVQVCQCL